MGGLKKKRVGRELPELQPGASITIGFSVRVLDPVPVGVAIRNQAAPEALTRSTQAKVTSVDNQAPPP